MRVYGKKLLELPDLSWKQGFAHTLFSFFLVVGISISPAGEYLIQHVQRPLDFKIRELWDRGPTLHPKLKLFAVDDSTVAFLKDNQLSLRHWTQVIGAIDARRPRRIIVDKIFGFEDHNGQGRDYDKWERSFRQASGSLVGGAFVAPRVLQHRSLLDLSHRDFQIESYLGLKVRPENYYHYVNDFALPRARSSYVYGPYPGIRSGFQSVGHIQYGTNSVAPFLRVDADRAVPHIGLFAANTKELNQGELILDGRKVPRLADGEILVNLLPFQKILAGTKSLLPTLKRASRGLPAEGVEPGDVVVVMPLMYTGNTDFTGTALGQMPASFIHVAVINSILSKDWLIPVNAAAVLVGVAALVGGVIPLWLGTSVTFMVLTLLMAALVAFSLAVFTISNISFPWIFPLMSLAQCCLTVSFSRNRMMEGKATVLRNALDGAVAPHKLTRMMRDPRQVNLEAREQVVTVMFIDVVGYSLLSEHQVPRFAFDQLKILLTDLSHEIHRHGGIVNKTLGDGLLCLFGYNLETDSINTDHAERAVACAIQIQRSNVQQNLKASQMSEPVYPLRIGLHTASVFLGDLGMGDRIDFTAVGNGVNYAKRMEQACEMHSVLFSATTKDLISSLGLAPRGIKKRLISIKHHTNLIEAFEYDPIFEQPKKRAKALEAYRQCANLARMEQRFNVGQQSLIYINSSVGEGRLINYSVTGMSVKLKSMLVRGSTLQIKVDSVTDELRNRLEEVGITEIEAEVRWVYTESDGHVHGVLFRNLSDAKALQLIDTLKHFTLSSSGDGSAQRPA